MSVHAINSKQAKRLKVLSEKGTPNDIVEEMERRLLELEGLDNKTKQEGTTAPQLFSSMNSFVANPSTVSVETYKRMIDTDETVGSGVDFLILCLVARFGEYKHKNPKVQKFIRRAIREMDGSWHENLEEMLSAEWAGFSATEIVWQFVKDFESGSAVVPKRLITYQPLTIVFAVDQAGAVLPQGIYQYQRYYGQHNTYLNNALEGNGFRPDFLASRGDFALPIRLGADLTYNVIRIDKDKIIHLKSSSTGKFGNPYGRSILRRCYKAWVAKDAALKLWIVAMDRKASPLLVGYAAVNETAGGVDINGNPVPGIRADVAMKNVFANLRNESAIVLPGKKGEFYEVDTIPVQGDMTVYEGHTKYNNAAIMRGLLIPPLILGGDGGGSFALGDAHRQIFQQVIDGKLKVYKQNILEQFIKQILELNIPQEEWIEDGLGDFVIEEFDPDVMEKLSNIYNTLTNAGYMSTDEQKDMDAVRQKFNLPHKKAQEKIPENDGAFDFGDEPTDDIADSEGQSGV